MGSRVASWAALALMAIPLGGCFYMTHEGLATSPAPLPNVYTLMHFEALSLINTRKTIGDHIWGWITDKDCSSPRAERGEPYCRDWPGRPPPPQPVYCYSTLAKPTCYAQPYNEGNDHLLGFVPPSAPVR